MVEKAKKHKKGSISEEDIATLLQRYTATTVLALLNEVANCTDVKIDWNALVEKTSTGISNAKEYQMLWRHLAYRQTLLQNFDDGAQPLGDDSDLEYELEAFPAVGTEASTEAAACVKVLIASGLHIDSTPSGSTVEAPLTINIPSGQSSRTLEQPSSTMRGKNITVPVSVQRLPVPSATVTDIDTNGSAVGNSQMKRKRKKWTEEEDLELIAAVQKYGEGNWANILRGGFKGDRTASQLSQRWSIIRKKHKLDLAGHSNGTQLSEQQLATRHAVSLALNMKNLTAGITAANSSAGINSNNSTVTNATKNSLLLTGAAETSMSGSRFLQSQKQSQENLTSKPSPVGSLGPIAKSGVTLKKPQPNSIPSSDPMLRAAAVAAGARIASPSDAASLIKAAQAKNAVHIMPTGGGSIKSSMATGGMPVHLEGHPNVHYIRTGLASPTISTYPAATSSVAASSPGSVKAVQPAVQHNPTTNGTSLDVSYKQKNDVSCTPPCELPLKQEVKTQEITVSESGSARKEQIQGDRACISANSQGEFVKENKVASPDPNVQLKGASDVGNVVISMNGRTAENGQVIVDVQPKDRESENDAEMIDSVAGASENHDAVKEDGENQNLEKMQEDLLSMAAEPCTEKLETVGKEAGSES